MNDDHTTSGLTPLQISAGLMYIVSGILHFVIEKFYTSIVPPKFPNPKALVYISGVAEIAGGIGVFIPRTRRLAGKGLIALLIAVFPANVNMALNPDKFNRFTPVQLWGRLPLQFAAIFHVWKATQAR
ncbi:MAG: DoxX family protein [Solirubrobacterales bacterium]